MHGSGDATLRSSGLFRNAVRGSNALLRYEGRISHGGSPRKDKLVTCQAEGFVPGSCETGDKFLDGASSYGNARVYDFPPSLDARALQRNLFKGNPLGHGDADSMINPTHFLSWNACGNYVVDDGVDGMEDFNLKSATWFPRVAVYPAQFSIDICEIVPPMNIGKNKPGERRARLGDNGILESSHNVLLTSPY
jgi:hypothetical protein